LTTEIFDTVFLLDRVFASIILLLSAIYAWHLIRIHNGGIVQKPWIVLPIGILVLAVTQLVSAASAALDSYAIRTAGGALQLIGSLGILVGLLGLVDTWRNFRIS
jgi:hypothetical protein